MNDLQLNYDELLDTFGQLETDANKEIKTLKDKLANALNSTKVRKDERETDNATDISPQGPAFIGRVSFVHV